LRFTVEALFLALLAAALTVADLEAPVIAALMLIGWLVVALYEWAATRERAHYGRGLPPRYYVPQVSLPPPRPLEQLPTAYTAGGLDDDTPTWIASPSLREEVLGEWPVGVAGPGPRVEDTVADQLPFPFDGEAAAETRLDLEDEDEDGAVARPAVKVAEPAAELADSEVAEELLIEEEEEGIGDEAEAPEGTARALEGSPTDAASVLAPAARYHFDPLAEATTRRRRRRRRAGDEAPYVEVAAAPPLSHVLPGQSRRES
jgi:hypothetical protein